MAVAHRGWMPVRPTSKGLRGQTAHLGALSLPRKVVACKTHRLVPAVEVVGQDEGADSKGGDAVGRGTGAACLRGAWPPVQLKGAGRETCRRMWTGWGQVGPAGRCVQMQTKPHIWGIIEIKPQTRALLLLEIL